MTVINRAITGLMMDEPLIFERSRKGRSAYSLPPEPACTGEAVDALPERFRRGVEPALPEVSELDVIRHFTRLSQWNYGIDTGMYPLGSCTMKYNPRVNEVTSRLSGFTNAHPYLPDSRIQGALELMYELENYLGEISGLDAVTLQPAAGAHGEFTGIRVIRRALLERDGNPRKSMLIPDSAHGTNPATCTLNGYDTIQIVGGSDGLVSTEAVREKMTEDVAGIMITNPNTLGLFEENLAEIAKVVHEKGGYVYCDGANLNAILGQTRPGDLGVDVMHYNLHKTFSTPHGGGGPGSGPVGVTAELQPYLPVPRIIKDDSGFHLSFNEPLSIGRVKAFYGNFGMLVRAYTYIREHGPEGLKEISDMAVLNANYVLARLRGHFHVAHDRHCMHECIVTDKKALPKGVKTMDIAKRLMDYGFHPPTVYFPLCVQGALMIEPTESESKQSIDEFVESMISISQEIEESPDTVLNAPSKTKVTRMDEATAARKPVLRWSPDTQE